MTQSDSDQKLLTIHRRRLAILKEQAAMFGASTPPHVLLEIEDIESQINALEGDTPAVNVPTPPASQSSGTTIIVQGDGNVIATDGGIAVGGDVHGDISLDSNPDE